MTDSSPVAEASITVAASPDEAFRAFTSDIGTWWRTGTYYWNDSERGLRVELEPGIGGRFREIYDETTDEGYEIGRVTTWLPGERLSLTWREEGWDPDLATDVEVTFEPVASGTRVTVRHSGWERIDGHGEGYTEGWAELLSWFAATFDDAAATR
jgi:uncharacterized protein YndB with AHSA1/START domain